MLYTVFKLGFINPFNLPIFPWVLGRVCKPRPPGTSALRPNASWPKPGIMLGIMVGIMVNGKRGITLWFTTLMASKLRWPLRKNIILIYSFQLSKNYNLPKFDHFDGFETGSWFVTNWDQLYSCLDWGVFQRSWFRIHHRFFWQTTKCVWSCRNHVLSFGSVSFAYQCDRTCLTDCLEMELPTPSCTRFLI